MITQTRLVQSRPRQNPDPAPLTNKWCVLNLAAETDNWLGIIEASDVKTAFENAHAAWESHADRIGIFNAQAFENELASFEQRFEKDAPATAWREAAYAVTIHHFGYFPEFLSVLPTLGVLTTPRDVACHSSGTTLVPNFPDETDLARPENRFVAEQFMIAILAGSLASARHEAQEEIEPHRAGFDRLRWLLEIHEPGRAEIYHNHLANFAAALLSGPLAEKVNAVAERLLDCRELDGVEFCQCLGKSQDGLAFGSSDAEIDGQHDAGFAFAKHATGFAFAKRDAVVPAPSARATK